MATLKFETIITTTDSRSGKHLLKTDKTFTYTKKDSKEYNIIANTEQIIFDPSVDGAETTQDFDFLYIISNGSAEMEVECDTGADVGREQLVFALSADVPFILGSNSSRAGVVAFDGFAGIADVIDKIVIKAGASTINVVMIMVK